MVDYRRKAPTGTIVLRAGESINLSTGQVTRKPQDVRTIAGRSYVHPRRVETCPVCGQPDNCGDCNHRRAS